ncbi:hypothetical protein, partial [Sulfurovum sp.]|uniref:hypothetical protein n=1 Tax=Sulfurovum sp. TaxID=1969726 RepID=UPI002A36E3B9
SMVQVTKCGCVGSYTLYLLLPITYFIDIELIGLLTFGLHSISGDMERAKQKFTSACWLD